MLSAKIFALVGQITKVHEIHTHAHLNKRNEMRTYTKQVLLSGKLVNPTPELDTSALLVFN